jgi:hypothetical protein
MRRRGIDRWIQRPGNYLIDNRRLIEEFGLQYRPLRQRVKEVINDIRIGQDLPPIS